MPSDLSADLDIKRHEFANMLGLSEPVSLRVLVASLEDETYVRNLLVARNNPEFLTYLLENPPVSTFPTPGSTSTSHSNLELMTKLGKALFSWAKTGFTIADAEVVKRREDACLSCPHLRDPESKLQEIAAFRAQSEKIGYRTGKQICELCGCVISNKIRLTSEMCPEKHPTLTGFSRWTEEIPDIGV